MDLRKASSMRTERETRHRIAAIRNFLKYKNLACGREVAELWGYWGTV